MKHLLNIWECQVLEQKNLSPPNRYTASDKDKQAVHIG